MTWRVLEGDCREVMRTLPAESVQCCVTSPPYWGLRDYGHAEQLGLERTPEEYVAKMVEVFREVRRVLRPDGTLWLNLGDSYEAGKQLAGVPWKVAEALKTDGWILRVDVVWHKPNVMPDAARDRPTRDHEYVFLLSLRESYAYDADAIRQPHSRDWWNEAPTRPGNPDRNDGGGRQSSRESAGRNCRTVWSIATKWIPERHFAPMPWDLAERCVLAGSAPGSTVLDPFTGSGTVGMVARRHGRSFVGCELNPEYAAMARERITGDAPLLNGIARSA